MNKRRFLLGIICSFILFLGVGAEELSAREATKPAVRLKLMGVNRTLDPWKLGPTSPSPSIGIPGINCRKTSKAS
jgi:hypothetical protein